MIKTFLAASALAIATSSVASAATVNLTSAEIGMAVDSISGQAFTSQLESVGASTLFTGDPETPLQLIASGPLRLTFSLVAAESGFNNALLFDGTTVIQENVSNESVDFATGILNGQTFSTVVGAGDFASRLSFSIGDANSTMFSSDTGNFGVFADTATLGALTRFYLALDDGGANDDGDFDDIIVRVDVSAVPLPAGGLLLLTALGGVAALRRRRKAA
ncbi:VPLPA-CTERM sorting domain-containing protein [Roseovarius autotrophicus]|uniref:VPLPA-CTERM sorting domain-containing protein n=1 Tax=Roseovarius autotrophicus TaxID=2824121 RepID=UPI002342F48B|nr:VPLPA-CTERM sorting domain-containing protein [Roseovarius autotrophicus]